MSELQQKITELVTTAAKESILSPEAMIEITSIVTDYESAKELNLSLGKTIAKLETTAKEARSQILRLEGREASIAIREGECTTREEKMLTLELTAEYQGKRVEDHREMVKLVFRNQVFKETMFGSAPAPMSDSGMISTQTVPTDETKTREAE